MPHRVIRVLIADHKRNSRIRLARNLRAAGYTVEAVCSGSDAILSCDRHLPDVLIIGPHLPDIDGFQVCARVRVTLRSDDNAPVIVLMADEPDEMTKGYSKRMAQNACGNFFLVKPSDGNVILALLERLSVRATQNLGLARKYGPTRAIWPTARLSASVACLSV